MARESGASDVEPAEAFHVPVFGVSALNGDMVERPVNVEVVYCE